MVFRFKLSKCKTKSVDKSSFHTNVTSYPAGIHFPPERITKWNLATDDYAYLDNVRACITVDLGKPLSYRDYVKVWHYYGDGRRYYTEGLWAGLENKLGYEPLLEYQLWSNYMYPEQARGRIFRLSSWRTCSDSRKQID